MNFRGAGWVELDRAGAQPQNRDIPEQMSCCSEGSMVLAWPDAPVGSDLPNPAEVRYLRCHLSMLLHEMSEQAQSISSTQGVIKYSPQLHILAFETTIAHYSRVDHHPSSIFHHMRQKTRLTDRACQTLNFIFPSLYLPVYRPHVILLSGTSCQTSEQSAWTISSSLGRRVMTEPALAS